MHAWKCVCHLILCTAESRVLAMLVQNPNKALQATIQPDTVHSPWLHVLAVRLAAFNFLHAW